MKAHHFPGFLSVLLGLCCLIFGSGSAAAQAAFDLEAMASLPSSKRIAALEKLLSTEEGRRNALEHLPQVVARLPKACESLVVRELLPVEFLTELWLGIQEKRFSVPPSLELSIVLKNPGLTLPDVLRGFHQTNLKQLIVVAGGFRGVGDTTWADNLTEMYTTLEACSKDVNAPAFRGECRVEPLQKYSKPIVAQLLRIQNEIIEQKVQEAPWDALNVIERLLRLDVEELKGLESRSLLVAALKKVNQSSLASDRSRILRDSYLSMLKELLPLEPELGPVATLLCVTGARDAIASGEASFAMQLLEESFVFSPRGTPEQAVLVAELSSTEAIFRSKELATRLDALPLRPVRPEDPAEPTAAWYSGILGVPLLGFLLLGLGAYVLVSRQKSEYARVRRAASARRKKSDDTRELKQLLGFFGLREDARIAQLTTSYHTAMMLNRASGDESKLKQIEENYLQAVELINRE